MNETRQDAWTKDEDILLAETVLRYIREGRTQLEAFKEVAEQLSRTSAACGFRWNATIRKQYQEAIQLAKDERKHVGRKDMWEFVKADNPELVTIDSAILLLEKMRTQYPDEHHILQKEKEKVVILELENKQLKEALLRYDHAWEEMGKLWSWVKRSKDD